MSLRTWVTKSCNSCVFGISINLKPKSNRIHWAKQVEMEDLIKDFAHKLYFFVKERGK
jgi:hypothetical protein